MAAGEQIAEGAPEELLTFAPLKDRNGLEIVDHIERRHFSIKTPEPVSPKPITTEKFHFPVDRGVTIETERLEVPGPICVYVRNSLGFMVDEMTGGDGRAFPTDRYNLELPDAIKTYLVFDSSCKISVSDDKVVIDLDGLTDVQIGARSHHKKPAATITTTDRPEDMMTAVSYLGSALKTMSCERSYPTLRGHPPAIKVGATLGIPGVLEQKEPGISIELPPLCEYVFPIASLAYYLGATVVPGERPQIVTEEGFVHRLDDAAHGYEIEVEHVLKQLFFLDCLTRNEGFYQVNLSARNKFDQLVNLDFARLYDEPLPRQVEQYLDIPYNVIDQLLPKWRLTAHIQPNWVFAEMLPFVVNDLAVIRTKQFATNDANGGHSSAVGDFLRGASSVKSEPAPSPSVVRIEEMDSLEQTWIGEGAPLGSSKAITQAFENRINRTPTNGDIDITLVCNAPEMGHEGDVVNEVYGSREELPFSISAHKDLNVDQMQAILGKETDFFHYIGHIDAGGFECSDGRFDASTLEETGVDVFLLNACTSYQQGIHLIEAGSIAGVVTLQDVINSGAERIGETLARLLNRGFPLQSALNIAKSRSIMGGHYLVVGDGSIDVAQSEGYVPALYELEKINEKWRLIYHSFLNEGKGMGSVVFPFIGDNDQYFLAPGEAKAFYLGENELKEYLSMDEMPVLFDNDLKWSEDFLGS